jgi:hypothetical protein
MNIEEHYLETCPGCGCEIDPDTCGCGDTQEGHPWEAGHNFVPMGCTCFYSDTNRREFE